MAVNLLDLAKGYLTDGVVGQVSTMLGENQQNTQKAFDGALPAILGSLVQKSSEPGGTSSIMDMVGEVMAPNRAAGDVASPAGGIAGNIGTMLSNGLQSSSLLSMGSGIIQSLFGDKAGAITGALASFSGIKQTSASSLMSLAGPMLLSVLGKKMADDGTGVSGLGSLLSSQAANVQSALPSGLGSLLAGIPGLSMLGGLGSKLGGMVSSAAESVSIPKATVPPVRPAAPAFNTVEAPSSGGGMKWLPWLLLLLGAIALFYFLRSCRNDGTNTVSTTTDSLNATMNDATTSVGAAMDSAGSAVTDASAALGAFFKRKLPSGLELNIPENGIENKLVTFIEDKDKVVDKTTWFNFDRLLFDTGKATLRPESQEQLTNIATILKEYPNVDLKLGGYTDNTGSAELNKKLSQDRADSVMGELVKMGIDKSRLAAEGYGPEHPVASNDTEAGRAENRRIAVRVTKK